MQRQERRENKYKLIFINWQCETVTNPKGKNKDSGSRGK